jgi:hypothetical protein
MKDVSDYITETQKETVVDFVKEWIKDGKDVKIGSFSDIFRIENKPISYNLSFSKNKQKLSFISVHNNNKDVSFHIDVDKLTYTSEIQYIEKFIIQKFYNSDHILSDDEFNDLTNLEADKTKFRRKKIKKIQDKLI